MTKTGYRILGSLLVLVGLFMVFKAARVSNFGFYRIGNRVSTAGILIVLFIIAMIAMFVRPCLLTRILVLLTLVLLLLSILLVIEISFYGITLVDVMLMVVPLAIGLGFIVKGQFFTQD